MKIAVITHYHLEIRKTHLNPASFTIFKSI